MYDIAQIRWSDDAAFARPVKDEDGYRLPVKLAEFDGDLVLNASLDQDVNLSTTSITNITTSMVEVTEVLKLVLQELRVISYILCEGLNVSADPDNLRTSITEGT